MPHHKSNGALRAERELAERRARRETQVRGRRRRDGDTYTPTRTDRRVAIAAALG